MKDTSTVFSSGTVLAEIEAPSVDSAVDMTITCSK